MSGYNFYCIGFWGEFQGRDVYKRQPLAVVEGLLTVLIVMALETYARPELRASGYLEVQ